MHSIKTKIRNWLSGLDVSTAKKKLVDDARKWGNRLIGLGLLSSVMSVSNFATLISKLYGLNMVPLFAVSHTWLVVMTIGVGVVLRGLAFVLDLKAKKKKPSSTKPATGKPSRKAKADKLA